MSSFSPLSNCSRSSENPSLLEHKLVVQVMESSNGAGVPPIKKQQEDGVVDSKGDKRDVKPIVKSLNRVPRMRHRTRQS